MGSASISRPVSLPPWSPWFWWPVLMLPYLPLASSMLRQHYLSNTAAFLLEKAYLIIGTGRLESIGFVYPPLPFLLTLPGHSPAWLALVNMATAALLATLLLHELLRTDLKRWLVVLIAGSIFFNPEFMRLATQDLPDMLSFLFLFLSFLNCVKWINSRQIVHAYQIGLWLAAAFLSSPSALYFVAVFVILLPFYNPGYPRRAMLAAASILIFPTIAALCIWIYLTWLFTGQASFTWSTLYVHNVHKAFFADWLWAAPIYWGTLLLLLRSPLRLLMHLVPLIMIVIVQALGLGLGLGLANPMAIGILFILFTIASISRHKISGRGHHIVLLVAVILQILVAVPNMRHLLDVGRDENTRIDFAVGRALAHAPTGSICTDDRQTYKLVAMTGKIKPFLLPADSLYAVAELQPAEYCTYLLVGDAPGAGLYYYVHHIPRSMVLEARFGDYRLYRRRDAPPLFYAR